MNISSPQLNYDTGINSKSLSWNGGTRHVSIWRCHLTSIGIPMIKIRRSHDRLIFIIGFPYLKRWSLYRDWDQLPWRVSCLPNLLAVTTQLPDYDSRMTEITEAEQKLVLKSTTAIDTQHYSQQLLWQQDNGRVGSRVLECVVMEMVAKVRDGVSKVDIMQHNL